MPRTIPKRAFYNAAVLVTKAGAVRPPYFKQRLVPFGEYVPLAGLLRRIRPISRAVPSAFTPGNGTTVLSLGSWRLGGGGLLRSRLPLDRARRDPRGRGRPLHAHERRVVRARGGAAAALPVRRRARDRDGPPARPRGDHRDQRGRGRDGPRPRDARSRRQGRLLGAARASLRSAARGCRGRCRRVGLHGRASGRYPPRAGSRAPETPRRKPT